MMMHLAPFLKQRFFDDNGDPLIGGKLYSYEAGTTTPLATYTDASGDTENENPIILDANGEADVWIGDGAYKFVLTDSEDNVIDTIDNVEYIPNDSIITEMLEDGSVTRPKIADNAVDETKIEDASIIESKIQTSAVTTSKIANESVTLEKMASDSVSTEKIVNEAVTKEKLTPVNVVNSSVYSGTNIFEGAMAEIADFAITISSPLKRPIFLQFANNTRLPYAMVAFLGVFSLSCNAKNATKNSGAASTGTAHTHPVDSAEIISCEAVIEIRREMTVDDVTDYVTVYRWVGSMWELSMNNRRPVRQWPTSSISFLDSDLSDTVGSDIKYKVFVQVSNSFAMSTSGANLAMSVGTYLKAVEL